MTDAYSEFLATKAPKAEPVGFECDPDALPATLKPFQRDITTWALRRGRAALFEGTGLGKTLQSLTWGAEVAHEAKRPVLYLNPLAVAEQTIAEADKFDIDGVAYASDQDGARSPIVVTNYDRAHLFDFSRFGGVILGESSILKAHDGKTRQRLTDVCGSIPYLLCETATPAPNDWTELGQHAEFLGVCSAKEMLSMYFVHDGANRANDEGGSSGDGWRLKRHAEREFWAWVASWSVMIRSPADLGYDEPGYDLPPLRKHQVTVPVEYGPQAGMLFPMAASTLQERIAARKASLPQRVAAAADLAREASDRPWVFWCDLNDESRALAKAIPGAVEITGSDSREDKKARMLAFSRGDIQYLISKPSICGFGMNWQHCRSTAFVGLNDSFEQVYQAIRRFWRFGQTEAVDAYMIASELEGAVVANQDRKERDFERMQAAMAEHMRDLTTQAVRGGRVQASDYRPIEPVRLPPWLESAA